MISAPNLSVKARQANWRAVICGLVAGVPAWVTLAHVLLAGWVPFGDEALIALRATDVFSADPPLVGPHTQGLGNDGPQAFHPGPLLYWVLAIPAQTGWAWALPATVAALNAAALVAIAVLAQRLVGLWFTIGVLVTTVLATRSIGSSSVGAGMLASIWNPALPLLPMVLLVLLCWGVVVGRTSWLPGAIAVGSLGAQSQVSFVPPVIALVGVAAVGEAVNFHRADTALVRRRHLLSWLASTGVGLVVWAAPLYQELTASPGNITRVMDLAGQDYPHIGLTRGWYALAHAVGWVPSFLRERSSLEILGETVSAPPVLTTVTAAAVLVGLMVIAVDGIRRRDNLAGGGSVLFLVLGPALGWYVASTPTDIGSLTVIYTTWLLVPVGGLALMTLLLGLARFVDAHDWSGDWQTSSGVPSAMARRLRPVTWGVGVLGLAATVIITSISTSEPAIQRQLDAAAPIIEAAQSIPAGGRYLVTTMGPIDPGYRAALAYRLHSQGTTPVVANILGTRMGDRYRPSGARCDGIAVLHITPTVSGDPTVSSSEARAGAATHGRLIATGSAVPGVSGGRPMRLSVIADQGSPSC